MFDSMFLENYTTAPDSHGFVAAGIEKGLIRRDGSNLIITISIYSW